jgi:hypothetical protein
MCKVYEIANRMMIQGTKDNWFRSELREVQKALDRHAEHGTKCAR